MNKLLMALLSALLVCSIAVAVQNARPSTNTGNRQQSTNSNRKRGPIFRASKDQIKQSQAILKERGFYGGEQTGNLDTATRDGLKKYQQAEGLKVTGTLNRLTLEKMGIPLTEKQQST
jgi:peptidoglycan hydrolase-like protein with peptidoglycan-binding domain